MVASLANGNSGPSRIRGIPQDSSSACDFSFSGPDGVYLVNEAELGAVRTSLGVCRLDHCGWRLLVRHLLGSGIF